MPMRRRPFAVLLLPLLAACGTAQIRGELAADGTCSATIDGTEAPGPDRSVRVVSRAAGEGSPAERHVLVVYCRIAGPDQEPTRIDFVKLNAPATGELEPGLYVIDTDGDQPRSIGVVVTAPDNLDVQRDWQPTRGTLEVESSTPTTVVGTFEVELRARGVRTF
jgi:hypothetical protein